MFSSALTRFFSEWFKGDERTIFRLIRDYTYYQHIAWHDAEVEEAIIQEEASHDVNEEANEIPVIIEETSLASIDVSNELPEIIVSQTILKTGTPPEAGSAPKRAKHSDFSLDRCFCCQTIGDRKVRFKHPKVETIRKIIGYINDRAKFGDQNVQMKCSVLLEHVKSPNVISVGELEGAWCHAPCYDEFANINQRNRQEERYKQSLEKGMELKLCNYIT